jgi:hypothetical protein
MLLLGHLLCLLGLHDWTDWRNGNTRTLIRRCRRVGCVAWQAMA